MNILILNYSLQSHGGSQMTSMSIAEALTRNGHRVFYGAARGPLVDRLESSSISYLELPLNRLFPPIHTLSASNVYRLARFLKAERIDVVHAFQYYPAVAALVARLRWPVPVYLSLLGPKKPPYRLPPGLAHTWAVSRELEEKIRETGLQGEGALSVLPNRLDLHRYGAPHADPELAARIGLAAGGRRICLVSRLHPGKMAPVETFLAAARTLARRFPELDMVVAGDGPLQGVVEGEVARINAEAGRTAVHLPGNLDMSCALGLFEIIIGMGRSVLEGCASGRPCVVVGPSGYVGVVDRRSFPLLLHSNMTGRGGPVAEDPSEALSTTVAHLLENPSEARRLGDEGRQVVSEAYDLERGARILEEEYERGLAPSARRSCRADAAQLADFFLRRGLLFAARFVGLRPGRRRSGGTRRAGAESR